MGKRKQEAIPEKSTKKPSKSPSETKYSLCIPSSIISSTNAYNLEQITYISYQIAKIATIYNISEIVILDIPTNEIKLFQFEKDQAKKIELGSAKGGKKIRFNISDEEILNSTKTNKSSTETKSNESNELINEKIKLNENNSLLFASLLQFFITPPYLIKSVFANNKYKDKFKYASKLPKLSTLPFMNNNNVHQDFKEGLTIAKASPKPTSSSSSKLKKGNKKKLLSVTKYVNIGESEPLELSQDIPVNVRVTVDIKNKKIVSPLTAYGTMGNKSSFGYFVRIAKTFSSTFTESSFNDGYTSSIYIKADDYFNNDDKKSIENNKINDVDLSQINVKGGQVLLVLGNLKDLEYSFKQDKSNLAEVENVLQMFDGELKIPNGVKIEDAALIALTKVNA